MPVFTAKRQLHSSRDEISRVFLGFIYLNIFPVFLHTKVESSLWLIRVSPWSTVSFLLHVESHMLNFKNVDNLVKSAINFSENGNIIDGSCRFMR